jgi:hypothetical protein
MPFRGPSSGYQTPPEVADYEYGNQQRQRQFDDALQAQSQAFSQSRAMRQGLDEDDANRRQVEQTKQTLAMTPGVSSGRVPTMHSVADSPLMSAGNSFTRDGTSYNFDPIEAGRSEGEAKEAGSVSADKVRYDALLKTPGISPRQAARLVYGKGDILNEPDPNDPNDMHAALANYVRQPSREAAAHAIQVGANLNQFPDRFLAVQRNRDGSEMPERPQAPVEGTPEYDDFLRRSTRIREDESIRGMGERYRMQAAMDPDARSRREAQQARLQLDEVRKDIPHPSKEQEEIRGIDAQGRTTMIPNPRRAAVVTDSISYMRDRVHPAQQRFERAASGMGGGQSDMPDYPDYSAGGEAPAAPWGLTPSGQPSSGVSTSSAPAAGRSRSAPMRVPSGASSGGLAPLSPTDAAHARRDPGFAEYLRKQGYKL